MPDSSIIKKKLILHVGIHKTGTTAIQAGMARHAGFLEHRGYSQAVMHWDLPFLHEAFNPKECGKKREDIDLESVRVRFRAWVLQQKCENIILSGEAMTLFFWQGRGCDDEVGKTLLSGFADMTVVLYFRRQDRFFESAYYQLVMNGLTDSLETFSRAEDSDMFRVLDWHAKVTHLQSLLPDARILVKLFEQATADGDIFRDFLLSIGIDDVPDSVGTDRENQSLGAGLVELVRLCSLHRSARHREALIRVLRERELPATVSTPSPSRLSLDERSRLLAHYHDSNARLFVEHGLGDLARWERSDSKDAGPIDRQAGANLEESLMLIDRLCAKIISGD